MAGAAQDVFDFVPDEVFDTLAGRSHILARIKFAGLFREDFANRRRHGHAQGGPPAL